MKPEENSLIRSLNVKYIISHPVGAWLQLSLFFFCLILCVFSKIRCLLNLHSSNITTVWPFCLFYCFFTSLWESFINLPAFLLFRVVLVFGARVCLGKKCNTIWIVPLNFFESKTEWYYYISCLGPSYISFSFSQASVRYLWNIEIRKYIDGASMI